jgi:hypothetical protein
MDWNNEPIICQIQDDKSLADIIKELNISMDELVTRVKAYLGTLYQKGLFVQEYETMMTMSDDWMVGIFNKKFSVLKEDYGITKTDIIRRIKEIITGLYGAGFSIDEIQKYIGVTINLIVDVTRDCVVKVKKPPLFGNLI